MLNPLNAFVNVDNVTEKPGCISWLFQDFPPRWYGGCLSIRKVILPQLLAVASSRLFELHLSFFYDF